MRSIKHLALATSALCALAAPVEAQVAPRSVVMTVAPGATGTAAGITVQDGSGQSPLLAVINPTTHALSLRGDDSLTTVMAPGASAAVGLAQYLSAFQPLTAYGAACDGKTDDSAAFARLDAAVGLGLVRDVYLPGTCAVKSATLQNGPIKVHASGGNGIEALDGTSNVLTMAGAQQEIDDVAFTHAVTRTAGDYLTVSGSYQDIRHVTFNDPFVGLHLTNPNSGVVHVFDPTSYHYGAVNPNAVDFKIEGGTDVILSHPVSFGTPGGSQGRACIEVTNVGDIQLLSAELAQCGTALLEDPGPGQTVASLRASNSFFDSSNYSVVLNAQGGYILRSDFVQSWFSSSKLGGGVTMKTSNGGGISGVDLVQPHIFGNADFGIAALDAGVSNFHVYGGEIAGNVNAAFYTAPAVVHFSLIGTRLGPAASYGANGTAFTLGPNNLDFAVIGNDVTGNTNAPTNASQLTATEIIKDNVGYASPCTTYVPSVAASQGAIATLGPVTGCYRIDGKHVWDQIDATITNNGTGAGQLLVGLPVPPGLNGVLFGSEIGQSGYALQAPFLAGNGVARAATFNNSYPASNGAHVILNGDYETP